MSWPDQILERFPELRPLAGEEGTWVVGGAVRDLLRGAPPVDIDLAVADPASAAAKVSFATRTVILGRGALQVFRTLANGKVFDFAAVQGADVEADLSRRDSTINAMAVELATGAFLDPHGGETDLRSGVVRMVRPSNFDDDPLRLLKVVRMAVAFRFTIEASTMEAVRKRAPSIVSVAPERVTEELTRIFEASNLRVAVRLLRETGLGDAIGLQLRDVGIDDLSLAAALSLLVDDPKEYGRRWKWSGALTRDVRGLQQLVSRHDPAALFEAGERLSWQLPPLLAALGDDSPVAMPDFSVRPLLDGDEITEVTNAAGPAVGRLKRALIDAQFRGLVRTKEEAAEFVRHQADGEK